LRRKTHAKSVTMFRNVLKGLENNYTTLKVNKNDPCVRLYQKRRSKSTKAKKLVMKMSNTDAFTNKALYEYFKTSGLELKKPNKSVLTKGSKDV